MDEKNLPSLPSGSVPQNAPPDSSDALLITLAQLPRRHRFRPKKRTCAALLLVSLTAVSAASAAAFSGCTLCYAVTADGDPLAYVQKEESYETAVAGVESRVSHILQDDYAYPQNTQVSLTIAPKEALTTSAELASQLMETVDQVETQCVLTVDGVRAGVCADPKTIEQAIHQAQASYHTGDTVSSSVENQTEITQEYLPADTELLTADELAQVLTDPAESHTDGSPLLTVRSVEEVTSVVSVPAPTEERADPERLKGERVTVQDGAPGATLYRESVVYCNGTEESRDRLRTEVLKEPVPKIIAVGTAELTPETVKGHLLWPCQGRITSPFGPRYIFGQSGFHQGMDIAVPQGTDLAAAMDGVVCWAGPKGSYGNLVQVDHGNGFLTYYGHCEQLLVREGQSVCRGQVIAKAGSTGRSTGPHCHFEVRWQNVPIDPRPCLP